MKRIWMALKGLLWPPRCVLCRRFLEPGEERICPACRASLPEPFSGPRRGSGYRRWAAAFWYEDRLREAFLRFKFNGCGFYAGYFGPLLARAVDSQLGREYDLMTYIPISPLRRRRRGYDQTLLLARAAGKELGMEPVCTLKKHDSPILDQLWNLL